MNIERDIPVPTDRHRKKWALRCFAWMVTTSRGQSEVEFTGDQIDHRFEVAH